jgi:hypothetical protein
MKANSLVAIFVFALGLMCGLASAVAQTRPEYIPLGGGVKAVLYRPDNNPNVKVGVIAIHRTADFLNHPACTELSTRGLMVLCMNSRFDNNEALVDWELIAQDVRRGVDYLKNTQHMNFIILFGHSGGGPTTTYYQAVAEKGPSYCQGPNKLTQCDSTGPRSVANLIKADGIVLADAHPGNTVNALRAINPSVRENQDKEVVGVDAENGPIKPQKNLDLFDPANGFDPTGGNSNYSENFVKRYTAAQSDRMNDWIEQALHIRAQMKEGTWRFPDDDSIIIAWGGASTAGGGASAAIFAPDTRQLCCTTQPEKLLLNDGSIVNQIIQSVRLPNPSFATGNHTFDNGTKNLTVTSFLSAQAIRSTDSLDYNQIDWCSSNNSTPCALQNISVPLLITAMGAHYFFVDSEQFYLNYAASHDKDFVTFFGLVHGIAPCAPGVNCLSTVGPLNNQVKNYWDYVFNWIKQRFGT